MPMERSDDVLDDWPDLLTLSTHGGDVLEDDTRPRLSWLAAIRSSTWTTRGRPIRIKREQLLRAPDTSESEASHRYESRPFRRWKRGY